MREGMVTASTLTPMLWWVLRGPRWLFFHPEADDQIGESPDVDQRWRLLVWANLVWMLWGYTGYRWGVFSLLLFCLAVCGAIIAFRGETSSKPKVKFQQFLLCLVLLSAAAILSSSHNFAIFGRLLQTMAVKEYKNWHHWCPDTHVTIMSVIVITCVVQGVPRFLLNLKLRPPTKTSHPAMSPQHVMSGQSADAYSPFPTSVLNSHWSTSNRMFAFSELDRFVTSRSSSASTYRARREVGKDTQPCWDAASSTNNNGEVDGPKLGRPSRPVVFETPENREYSELLHCAGCTSRFME